MNTSAFSDFISTPALADDDVALATFANAIGEIDGLHRGPGRRKPRRIPLTSCQREHDESFAQNVLCGIKPNQEPHPKSSSATCTTTTIIATSSHIGHYDSSTTSLDFSSSSTLADDMMVGHPSSSPTSTSTSPRAEPPVDGGIPVGLTLEISSHSSFTAPVNFGDYDDDGGGGDDDTSLDPTDLPTDPPTGPGRKKRARGCFRGELNDIEPRSSPRRRYKSPNHNLRIVLHEIQVGIDCMSSDDEYEPAELLPSKLLCPEQRYQEYPAVSNKINLLTKPSPQQEQFAAPMLSTTAHVGDNEGWRCLRGRYELNVHEPTSSNIINAFSNKTDRLAEDSSGWAALMSLFMT